MESLRQFNNANDALARLTVNGGETVSEDYASDYYAATIGTTVVKWRVVYSLSVFVALSLLPVVWATKYITAPSADQANSP